MRKMIFMRPERWLSDEGTCHRVWHDFDPKTHMVEGENQPSCSLTSILYTEINVIEIFKSGYTCKNQSFTT